LIFNVYGQIFLGETEWQWTAPEVVADESVLCTKSDVWSFGVVMYEIITFGGVPYAGYFIYIYSKKCLTFIEK
jgi:serine/threonine protein kinase